MSEIVNERIRSYIFSLDRELPEYLGDIRKEAIENDVPIIRQDSQELIKTLLYVKKPMRILEVGTAVGFSALYMSEYMPADAHITTIENYPPRIEEAKKNFEKANRNDKITLLEGDAMECLREMDQTFDFIFMDAAKGQYINFLPEVLRILKVGGLLVSDNVLQDGDVIKSRYGVEKRDRTIHSRMREYLYEIKHNDQLDTSILSVGDGMALSYKLK